MQKITTSIFEFSPKKLAICLVLGPLLLFLAYTAITISFRPLSHTSGDCETNAYLVFGLLFIFLAVFLLLWLFWLRATVLSIEKSDLGLPLRWFNLSFVLFVVYLLYNLCFSFIALVPEGYRHIFYALNEFVAFGGLIVAYPTLCHYAARAVVVQRSNVPATFMSALPFTLLLLFGTVLGIPFLHKYFSAQTSTNSQIITIYAIAFGVFAITLVVGFIAAITGLV